MAKILIAIVSEELMHLAENHQLLPELYFRECPGRTTSDVLHVLICRIKEAWRQDKVVSILFLDIKGAFPNAVMDWLLHNM